MLRMTVSVLILLLLSSGVSPLASRARPQQDKKSREAVEAIRAEFARERAAQDTWLRLIKVVKRGRWEAAEQYIGREVKFSALVSRWNERSLLLSDSAQPPAPSAPRIVALLSGPMERYPADSITVEVLGKVEGFDRGGKEIKVRANRVRVTAAD